MSAHTARLRVQPVVRYRIATEADVAALAELEARCFDIDRLSRRSFSWLIRKGHSWLQIAEVGATMAGYVLVLFHRGTSLARLYSLAVDRQFRGMGLAPNLLAHAESEAVERGCVYMRLEVHPSNRSAIGLYEERGYRRFGLYRDYYDDHADALRYEKRILFPDTTRKRRRLPFYAQSTHFTCGPACLMMAMKALDPTLRLTRKLELALWRESTTIFMMSGHGGCGPHGLALAAHRRGFATELFLSAPGPLFVDSVRSRDKKLVLELVHEEFIAQANQAAIPIHYRVPTLHEIGQIIGSGAVAITLVSTYRWTGKKIPHWVVVAAMDERFVYLHDPDTEDKHHDRGAVDNAYMPVPRRDFERSACFGQARLRATLIVNKA